MRFSLYWTLWPLITWASWEEYDGEDSVYTIQAVRVGPLSFEWKASDASADGLNLIKCNCKFIAIDKPLDNTNCAIHIKATYTCERTSCDDYRPARTKLSPTHWPRCVCGEIAQDHN